MNRLVPGLLSFLFACVPSAFAGTPAVVSWEKIAQELSCDRATGADQMICEQARKAYCREYSDPKCTENVDSALESKLNKQCAASTGDRDKTLKACGGMSAQMMNCCDSKNVAACLDEIGPALKLADPSEGSGLKMLCTKAGADMTEAATANAAIAGTCAMRGIVWREHCNDAMKTLNIASPALTSAEKRSMNCTAYSTPAEVRAQLESLLDDSKIAQACNDKSGDGTGDDPVAGPGSTSPSEPGADTGTQSVGGGAGGGMEMLGAMMPLLGEMMKPKTGDLDDDDGDDEPSEITFENTECDPSDATCIAKKLTEPAPVTADAAKSGAGAVPQFNPGTVPDMGPQGLGDLGKASDSSNATGGVPNGGGGIPGGGGGGGGGAMPGGRNTAGAPTNTDIMRGFQGGGGYSEMNAGMTMTPTSTGGFRGYGGGGSDTSVDLAQFLPNGARDPRKGMGASDLRAIQMKAEISDRTVNMFNRVSERIKMRCAQGLLRDCIP